VEAISTGADFAATLPALVQVGENLVKTRLLFLNLMARDKGGLLAHSMKKLCSFTREDEMGKRTKLEHL
jgi:hypothetical protein